MGFARIFLCVLFFTLFSLSVVAEVVLPPGVIAAQGANEDRALLVAGNITFFVAFIAGILTFLSPCILPLFPAFFSYTFKEKSRITKMTILFFLGFAATFVALGMVAASLGGISLTILQQDMGLIIQIAGAILIGLGVMALFGKGFGGIIRQSKMHNDAFGVFVFGAVFALGWSACIGPIIAGILLMASLMANFLTAAYLMFSYALGVFVPLFLISFFYDKYDLSRVPFIRGKELTFRIGRKVVQTHTSNLIAGILFILLGLLFIIFKSTAVINTFDLFGTKLLFFEWQRWILENPFIINFVGIITLVLLGWCIWEFAIKRWKNAP